MRRSLCFSLFFGVAAAACGAELEPGANATVDGALWTEFSASVRQSAALYQLQLDPNGTSLAAAQRQEIWRVDDAGAASYVQVLRYQEPKLPTTTQILAQQQLAAPALVALKNKLARYQAFGWQDVYPCSGGPLCADVEETTTLELNLNGEKKTVVWQASSLEVPPEARRMAQALRDAI